MRSLLLVFLLLFGGCNTYNPAWKPEYQTRHWYDWLASGTVQVFVNCGKDGAGSGSGVVVGRYGEETYVATAFHVTDPGCVYLVEGYEMELAAYDEYYDQSILVGVVPGRVAEESGNVFVGQRVLTVGYPYQPYIGLTGFQITHGTLTAFVGDRYKTNADSYYGSSGGPCFDMEGRLVGLVVSMRVVNDVPVEWYVTPAWRTYELLREARYGQ